MRLGVPEILLSTLRRIVTDEDVEEILPQLPIEASDAIIMLAADYKLEEIFQQLEKPQPPGKIDPENLEIALQNLDSLSRYVVITNDTELEEMLAAPLEKWRVFLHPSQRKLVERDWNGAVRVLGGAGTGKTVVAMHRAKWLIENRFTQPTDRILITTFTRNLSIDISNNLKTIVTPEDIKRINIINLDQWVNKFLKQQGIETEIVYEDKTQPLWEKAYNQRIENNLSLAFYQQEWKQIVQPNQCKTLKDYLKVTRIGRGTRLNRQQRQHIWIVFEEYMNLLLERGFIESEEGMQNAIQIINMQNKTVAKYQSVIVDEGQDMSKTAFKLIRAITGTSRANDIFIVGDAHQRLYGQPIVLSQCEIDIKGRSKRLRLNYRTTDETRKWATDILAGTTVDDLEGGVDTLKDYRSLMHGESPIIRGFDNFEAEIEYLYHVLKELRGNKEKPNITCIVLRTDSLIKRYKENLKGIEIEQIGREQGENGERKSIKIATMHRVKGLQFDHIIIPGLTQEIMPLETILRKSPDPATREELETKERSLLYVAATRAKKQVIVTYHGIPSSFLINLPQTSLKGVKSE
jgi:superfamily I DNA/RNA helicase